jgi:hypothetical protein
MLFGSEPEKKYRSSISPMMRYCITDRFKNGGDAKMVSDPAALGTARHGQGKNKE